MRNLLAFIGLVVVGGGVLGWYMGWYKLSFTHGTDGNLQIKADVDTKKAGDDIKNAAATVGNQIEKNAQDGKPPAGAPGNTPGPGDAPQTSTFNPFAPAAPEVPAAPVAPITPPQSGPIRLIPPK